MRPAGPRPPLPRFGVCRAELGGWATLSAEGIILSGVKASSRIPSHLLLEGQAFMFYVACPGHETSRFGSCIAFYTYLSKYHPA